MWQGEHGRAGVLDLVCDYLTPAELLKCRLVNHAWSHTIVRSPAFPAVRILKHWEHAQRRRPFAGVQHAKNVYLQAVRVQRGLDGVLFWHRYWPVFELNLVSLDMFHIDIPCWRLAELINECVNLETLVLNDIKFDHQPAHIPAAMAAGVPERVHRIYCFHEENPIPMPNRPTIKKLALKYFKHAVVPNCLHLLLAARSAGHLKEFEYSGHKLKVETRPAFLPTKEQVNTYLFEIIRRSAGVLSKLSVFGNHYGHELLDMFRAHRHIHVPLDHLNIGNIAVHAHQPGNLQDFLNFIQDQQNIRPLQSLELAAETVDNPTTFVQVIQQCTSLKKLVLTVQKADQVIELNFLQRFPLLTQLVINEQRVPAPGAPEAPPFGADYLLHAPQALRKFTMGHRINDENKLQVALGLQGYALLTELAITEGSRVTDVVCQTILRNLTTLEKLCINNATTLTDTGLTGLNPAMVDIILKNKDYQVMHKADSMLPRVDGLNIKNQLRRLWSLDLKGCKQVSDVTLHLGIQFPRLTEVNVSYLTNVTDLGLNWLCQNNPQLTKITCKHNRNVTHFGLNFILRRFDSKLSEVHITKEIGDRKLGDLPYEEHPDYKRIVSVAAWNEPR